MGGEAQHCRAKCLFQDHRSSFTSRKAQFWGLIDRVGAGGDATRAQGQEAAGNGNTPAFFSGDLAGLSRTFAAMQSERVVERQDGPVVRQTVTYCLAALKPVYTAAWR